MDITIANIEGILGKIPGVPEKCYLVRNVSTGLQISLNLKDSDVNTPFTIFRLLQSAHNALIDAGVEVSEKNVQLYYAKRGTDGQKSNSERIFWPCIYVTRKEPTAARNVSQVAAILEKAFEMPEDEAALFVEMNGNSEAQNVWTTLQKLKNDDPAIQAEKRRSLYRSWLDTHGGKQAPAATTVTAEAPAQALAEELI